MKKVTAESDIQASHQDKQRAENYLNLLHALPHPLAVFRESDRCIVAANHHFCNAFRLSVGEFQEGVVSGFYDFPSGLNDKGETNDRLHIRMFDDGVIQFNMPDGRRPRVKADVLPCRYGDQNCWLVTTAAATEQNPSGDGALKEQKSYRSLVENLNDIVYTTDENAVVTYVSPNIIQLAGYRPSEVIGRNFVEFVHPEDLRGRIEQFLKILGGENQATEYRLFTKTGEIKWARTSARPIRKNGQVVGVQGILVDITDRKEIEEALKRSEEKYRILVQHSKDAIFVLQDDHIRFMNPSASEILGYTCDCIADKPFIEFVHPDDREVIMDRYFKRLRGEILSDRVFFRILNKDGHVRDVEVNAVLITWEEKPGVLNFLRDITLQNMMEAQLRKSQKMEAIGTLAGGIAHNFNNLLMGIHGNATLSLNGMDPSARTYKYLDKISKLVESGSKLTHQLLDYARGGNCEVGSVDLNHLVREASETLLATKKQIRINQKLSKDIHCIRADKGQLEQVLLNLLLNAADAMPNGGDVSVETSYIKGCQAKAETSLSSNKDYVLLKVSDLGAGIPKDILDRIFEPFFTTKGFENGSGLGLSTAYSIVKNHHGEIYVESEVNKGSSFLVYLPSLPDGSIESVPDIVSEVVARQGTILLIDDEPEVIETSSKLLELMDFTVIKAADGEVALEIFQKDWERIELVILDLVLPNMSGRDLYYKLKEINPKVKVLISSGFGISGHAEELLKNGCRGFIQKPYNINQLSEKMMAILSAE